jgi:glyoxylase-like metal-dependent hydrolase (beta-lactamase superfamily II)
LLTVSEAGIHRFTVPAPFAVGEVNCYLVDDDPLTLVDCGPDHGSALESLRSQLAGLGRKLTDIGLLLLTHPHPNHLGLAHLLAERGTTVACLDVAAPAVEQYDRWSRQDDDDALALMLRHGVPANAAACVRRAADVVRRWTSGAPVGFTVRAGDSLELGSRRLDVLHRPGHSPYDTVFVDTTHRVAIAGDHLLGGISSNAITAHLWTCEDRATRSRPLLEYRRSLRATAELDVDVVLGGHGDPIRDHRALIARRLSDQDRRADSLLARLTRGPVSAHELAVDMFGDSACSQPFATLSEVLGHLDLLLEAGEIVEIDRGAATTFAARKHAPRS